MVLRGRSVNAEGYVFGDDGGRVSGLTDDGAGLPLPYKNGVDCERWSHDGSGF